MALRIDLHVHSSRSLDGALSAEELIGRAERAGLDGLVLTEHGERWSERDLADLRRRTQTRLIVLSAEELLVDEVAILAYGFSGRMPPLDSLETAVGRIRLEGGIAIAAHAFDEGARSLAELQAAGIQGVEVYSASNELPTGEQLAELARLGMVAVAGSGFHGPGDGDVGDCHTLVEADVRSGRDLAVAIRTRRATPVFGPPPLSEQGHRAPRLPIPQGVLTQRPGAFPASGTWKE